VVYPFQSFCWRIPSLGTSTASIMSITKDQGKVIPCHRTHISKRGSGEGGASSQCSLVIGNKRWADRHQVLECTLSRP
jgi:hypothetical protein